MNCKDAEKLIMNYMDNTLSEKDAIKLNEHLKQCGECREAFAVYEVMMDHFQGIEIVEAPVCFEQELMTKISAIEPVYLTQKPISMEWVHSLIWGLITLLFGTGVILNVYKDKIMGYLSQNQYTAEFYQTISPVGNLFVQYINEGFKYVESITAYLSGFGIFSYLKIICGISIIVLCGVEIWSKRSKVDA
jgi:hypothetical protein